MRRAAFVILTAAALALAGCGGAEQDAAQKARRAAVEAERRARKALIKAALAEWEAYRNKGKETYRNKGYSLIKQVMLTEIPDAGPVYEYLDDYDIKKERDALIKAAPAEWDAYVTAREAQGALRNAAPDEWTEFDFVCSGLMNDQGLGYLERLKRMKRLKAAETGAQTGGA